MKQRTNHLKNRSGFTLTELLAVIVIVGILMAASIPAFMSMGGSAKANPAASQLAATLRLARQYAIANNQSISVVFPHATASVHGTNITAPADLYPDFNSKQRMLRGYAVYSPRDGYVTDWKFLPDGVIFNPTNSTTNVLFDDNAIIHDIPYPDNSSPVIKMQAVTYQPDGTTKFGVIAFKIFLSEGFTNAAEDPAATSLAYTVAGTTPLYLEIAPLTGIVKVKSN